MAKPSLLKADEPFFTDSYQHTKVHLLPSREDNFSYLLEDHQKNCLIIDPSEKAKVKNFIIKNNLKPLALLLTHHHYDHVDGLKEVQEDFNIPIYASALTHKALKDKNINPTEVTTEAPMSLKNFNFKPLFTPGHTRGHTSFFFPKDNLLFCGDILFSLGCGRVFERYDSVFEDYFKSLEKLKKLPSDTQIYCAHEYTLANYDFCLKNQLATAGLAEELIKHFKSLNQKRSLPSHLAFEKAFNPFLKAKNARDFKDLRDLKDQF